MKQPSQPNVSPCGCSQVTQQDVSGSDGANLSQTAKALAEKHQLSLRTAYRHLARGTTPTADRRIGQDGKTYPASPRGRRPDRTPLERELALTGQALNRADLKACQAGFSADDLGTLRRIVATASEMLNRWEGVRHGDDRDPANPGE